MPGLFPVAEAAKETETVWGYGSALGALNEAITTWRYTGKDAILSRVLAIIGTVRKLVRSRNDFSVPFENALPDGVGLSQCELCYQDKARIGRKGVTWCNVVTRVKWKCGVDSMRTALATDRLSPDSCSS